MLNITPRFSAVRTSVRIGTLFISTLTSLAVAASVTELLPVSPSATVSRGVFLQVAMTSLDTPLSKTRSSAASSVSTAMQPYVQAATSLGIMDIFGKNPDLSAVITRGEAAQVLFILERPAVEQTPKSQYADAKSPALSRATKYVVDQQWMTPVSKSMFGVGRAMTSREARLIAARLTRPSAISNGKVTIDTSAVNIVRPGSRPVVPDKDVLNEVWDTMHTEYYYGDKYDTHKAIRALVEAAGDPYTEYLAPVESRQFHEQLQGSFEGIGAVVENTGSVLYVVTPFKNSPAEKAGIKPKDAIIKVDGKDIGGMTSAESVALIRGPHGTTVVLTILRDGQTFETKVIRDRIEIPVIETDLKSGVPVIKLSQFLETTAPALEKAIKANVTNSTRGIVLDLRNNPGGLLSAAEDSLGTMIPRNTVYFRGQARNENFVLRTTRDPIIPESTKIIVLVNSGSASAAEVMAGTLQDLKRSTIVGEKTFGKGSAQRTVSLSNGGELKFTFQEWFTPNNRPLNKVGLVPDLVIKNTPEHDEQLDKAIELAR